MPDMTDTLAIKLTITEWNQILQVLSDGQYKTVAPLMHKITLQAAEQVNPVGAPMIGNGAADIEQAQPPVPSSTPDTSSHRRGRQE